MVIIVERYLLDNVISDEDYYIIRKYIRYFLTKKQFMTKVDDIDELTTEIVGEFLIELKNNSNYKASYTSYQKHKYLNLLIWTAIYNITVNKDFIADIPPYLLRQVLDGRYTKSNRDTIVHTYHLRKKEYHDSDKESWVDIDTIAAINDPFDLVYETDKQFKLDLFNNELHDMVTKEERTFINEHYTNWRTYRSIGDEYNMCSEFVRQKIDKGIKKLKKYLASKDWITI